MTKNKRIIIDKKNRKLSIKARCDQQKQLMLSIWLILWTLAGLGIISQFFFPAQDGLVIYLIILLSFWIYFEYKVFDAFRWRKYGEEIIIFDDDYMSIENCIAGRGIPHRFEHSWMKNLRMVEHRDKSFWQTMNSSYWNVGQEGLTFEFKGRQIFFGRELNAGESKEVLSFLKSQLNLRTTQ